MATYLDIEAPGAEEAALQAALRGLTFPAVDTTKTAFWADVDAATPRVWRMRDRVFVGNAALMHGNRSGANTTWAPDATTGANWAPRDSQFVVMQDRGGLAVTGMSRASDGDSPGTVAPIGVAGFLINDAGASRSGWALYGDVQHQPVDANSMSFGLELAVKNKSSDFTDQPYQLTWGAKGLWLAGGGDEAYGGANTNPCNTAIVVLKNSTTWNRGIVFEADALTGTDGVTGAAIAMSLARGHILRWYYAGGNTGASIRSDVDAASSSTSMLFDDNLTSWSNSAGKRYVQFNAVASGVNFLNVTQSIASSPVLVAAAGDDTNINLTASGKGTGVLTTLSQLLLSASTTARASMNIPTGTAPTSPVNGDMWVESNTLKIRLNGATVTVTTA